MHGEIHRSHLGTIAIGDVRQPGRKNIQRGGEISRGVLEHEGRQAVATVACITPCLDINRSVLIDIVPNSVVGRDEHAVLISLAREDELFNGAVTVHVAKVNGAR